MIFIILGLLIGAIVGVIDTVFGRVLLWIGDFRNLHLNELLPFLGIVGIGIVVGYQKFAGKAARGMTQVFMVSQESEENIPLRLIPFVTVATWLTHLFGGSAGREGVAVQIGATMAHRFQTCIPEKSKKKSGQILLVTGVAAGFGGLFGTPIAATFFGLELFAQGQLELEAALPALVAAFTASQVSAHLGLEKFEHNVDVAVAMTPKNLIFLMIAGILFGLVGNLFIYLQKKTKALAGESIKNPYLRVFVVGVALSFIIFLLHHGRYAGLGTNLISESLGGKPMYTYDWLLKLLLTVVTLSVGFQGGEVTPLFAIGSSFGWLLSSFIPLPGQLLMGAGYMAVFGSATNTLLAPIFIGGEVFGYQNIPYFVIVMLFAYFINRRASIYGLQRVVK